MASTLLRRSLTTAALSALTVSGAPLVGGSAAAATPPPAFQPASSTPIAGGSVMYGNDTITATFDQPVTGNANSMKVYERNADGTRGFQLPGSVSFTCSSLSGPGKSASWKPSGTLVNGEYEVVVNATGTKSTSDCSADTTRPATADYDYFVVGTVKPTGLTPPQYNGQPVVNNTDASSAPFSGALAPGLTVTVTVPDPQDPTGQSPRTGSASTVVPACGTSSCPWTVKVDVSQLPEGSLKWNAVATDSVQTSKSTDAVQGPAFVKDTSAPSAPTLASSPSLPAKSTTLTVPKATPAAADTDVTAYTITVTDPEKHAKTVSLNAAGDRTMPSQSVDVSSLDDGTLTVAVQAVDTHGNVSSPCCKDQFGQQATPTVTKTTGLVPNLTTSTVTTPAGDVTFADAATHGVQPPSSIDVEFSQPVELSYTNNNPSSSGPSTTHNSSACLTSPEGNCIVPLTPKLSSSGRGLTLAIPKGSLDPNGSYALAVTTYSKNLCPDVNPGGTDNCASNGGQFSDLVRVGALNSGNALVFHLDSTPPTISLTQLDTPVTASNLQTASLAGTVDSDVSAVEMTLTSSNAPSRPRVASLQTSTNNGTTSFSASPLPLSGMVDGVLDVELKATDAAGNSATKPAQIVLNALALTLVPGDGKILVTWTKPTLTNGAAPTYALYYHDQSVANAPVHSLAPASTATSQLIGGLTDGHDYGVVLTASDSAGSGPVAVGDAAPRGGAALSLSAPARLTYGTSVVLKGKLAHGRTGVSGAAITITPYYGGKAAKALHVKTTSTGAYSVKVRPLKTVTYVATFAGDSSYGPATFKRRVGLRVNIRITKVSGSTLQGTVSPNMKARKVTIYERIGKKNHKVGTAKLTSKSTWTFKHRWSRGTHYVFANFVTQNSYYGNNSSKKKIVR